MYFPSVSTNHFMYEGQPQTKSCCFRDLLISDTIELFKNLFLIFRCNSHAIVFNNQNIISPLFIEINFNDRMSSSIFNSIVHKIDNNIIEIYFIEARVSESFGNVILHPGMFSDHRKHFCDHLQFQLQVDRFAFHLQNRSF